jgi:hypothetical protein
MWRYERDYERDLGFTKIFIRNRDSSKNVHREIEFTEVKEPIVVWHYGNKSGSRSFSNIYLINTDLTMQEISDIKNEIEEIENGNVIYVYNVAYVVINQIKVIINKEFAEKKYKAYKVKLFRINNKVLVKGDTYPIKDELKKLGFKWDSYEKAWYTESENYMQLLSQIPNLQIET